MIPKKTRAHARPQNARTHTAIWRTTDRPASWDHVICPLSLAKGDVAYGDWICCKFWMLIVGALAFELSSGMRSLGVSEFGSYGIGILEFGNLGFRVHVFATLGISFGSMSSGPLEFEAGVRVGREISSCSCHDQANKALHFFCFHIGALHHGSQKVAGAARPRRGSHQDQRDDNDAPLPDQSWQRQVQSNGGRASLEGVPGARRSR